MMVVCITKRFVLRPFSASGGLVVWLVRKTWEQAYTSKNEETRQLRFNMIFRGPQSKSGQQRTSICGFSLARATLLLVLCLALLCERRDLNRHFVCVRTPAYQHTQIQPIRKKEIPFVLGIHVFEEGKSPVVLAISHLGKTVHLCEICGFGYADEASANSCENFCREHKSCSLQITKKAVLRPE